MGEAARILVYPFPEAPEEFRRLNPFGARAVFVAAIPDGAAGSYIAEHLFRKWRGPVSAFRVTGALLVIGCEEEFCKSALSV